MGKIFENKTVSNNFFEITTHDKQLVERIQIGTSYILTAVTMQTCWVTSALASSVSKENKVTASLLLSESLHSVPFSAT